MTEEELKQQLTAAEEQSKERATKAAERIKNYQRQASLDLEAMTQLRVELHTAEEQLAEMRRALGQISDYANQHTAQGNIPFRLDWVFVGSLAYDALQKALSAAPKRGQVIGKVTVTGRYRHAPSLDCSFLMTKGRGFVPHLNLAVPHSEAEDEREGEFTVTVREEAK